MWRSQFVDLEGLFGPDRFAAAAIAVTAVVVVVAGQQPVAAQRPQRLLARPRLRQLQRPIGPCELRSYRLPRATISIEVCRF